jgi:hypothetical protein
MTKIYVLPGSIVTNALKLEGDMGNGDRLFSVSEVQAYGVPIEPNLWAVKYRWGEPAPGFSYAAWPILESWMNVKIENTGKLDAYNVTASIIWAPVNTTIVDGDVTVGDIPACSSAWSIDTFTTRVDMSSPIDPSEGIFWLIEYDDAAGVHHVEIVPEFKPKKVKCGLTTIDFDDRPDGSTLVGDEYSALGVTFSGHYNPSWMGDPPDIVVGIFSPPGTITLQSYCNTSGYIEAAFTVPVDYVSVELTTFETGDYDLGLELYDASDNLVAQTTTTGVNGVTYFLEAQSSSAVVAYARFYGYYGGIGGVNATYADNFTFGIAP